MDSISYISDELAPFVVSIIKWEKIPVEATGYYECYNSADSTLPATHINLNVPSTWLQIFILKNLNYIFSFFKFH